MDSPAMISTEYMKIIKSYSCDNIIKCVIEPRTWLSYNYFGMTYAEGLSEAETTMKSYFDGNNSNNQFSKRAVQTYIYALLYTFA
ncbi:hypothetical protein FGIG_08081 [Fasciola gigantica]|uniref:Uncharacterized protein n=1 Tax=Fasciola gigantica TaxID=46835 RepID=A0A504YMK8_FASGI|nr:hypothetical protein FGIG_08081 [Fasciola gigantica]